MRQVNQMAKAGRPAQEPLSPFGLRLRAAIDNAFPTRHEFTRVAKLHNSTLHNYELGIQSPRIKDVEAWALLLNVSPGWLAFGVESPGVGIEEQAQDVAWAAATIGLDEDGLRTLQRARAVCGPMTRPVLLTVAESIARASDRA